uniref:Uncharacterized protein n=1 Tax=Human herpesvirus 2 TaxID=10310 RepID=A0A481TN66_HHV2|nr:hypothetical protein [Human alphaherpesvirus 2]
MRCDSTALAPAPLSPPLYQSSLAPGFAPVVRLTPPSSLPEPGALPLLPTTPRVWPARRACSARSGPPPCQHGHTLFLPASQPAHPPRQGARTQAGPRLCSMIKTNRPRGWGRLLVPAPPPPPPFPPPHPRPPCVGELHQRPTTKCVKSITKLYCKIFINIKFFFSSSFQQGQKVHNKMLVCVAVRGRVRPPPSHPHFLSPPRLSPPTSPCPRGASAGGPVGGGFPSGSKPSVSSPYSPWPAGASPAGAGAPCSRDHGWRDRRPWKSSAPTRVPWSKSMLPTGVIQRLFHSDAGGVG